MYICISKVVSITTAHMDRQVLKSLPQGSSAEIVFS